jgi:hypothetical protein
MPLIDHFHAPVFPRYSWESFHSLWSAAIVERLNALLPTRYLAQAQVHLGQSVEADVAEFDQGSDSGMQGNGAGGVAVATYAPPVATHVLPAVFPDDIEVRVIDTRDDLTLVAVVELVSPRNKDREEASIAFTDKCAAYLRRGVGVVVVDIVSSRRENLHNTLIERLRQPPSFAMPAEAGLYATAYRPVRRGEQNQIDVWLSPLALGQALPEMPLGLRGNGCVPVDLEATYTRARQASRL